MKNHFLLLMLFLPVFSFAQKFTPAELKKFQAEAKSVTIIRDNWGVPHIYGKTDAAVVFGLMYAQCEENFAGIERNYLYQLGKQAEVDGEKNLYTDVQLQLIADSTDAIKDYQTAEPKFKKLLDAFADGLNYYLYKHPETKSLFHHFEPWYALMFTDGSVAATITGGINLNETKDFYSGDPQKLGAIPSAQKQKFEQVLDDREIGSNGFAIAPKKSASGHALLYINPHVPFYFRSEVQLVSEEGLNAYGAVTWGQFFIYQGFNAHCGWMHTSSYADVADLYEEKVHKNSTGWVYEYEGKEKPIIERKLVFGVKEGGKMVPKTITGFYTDHGPILGSRNGKWLSLKANNRSYKALLESWLITKASNFAEYKKAMDLLSNATNNTVYADDKGNIAFWYGNFMPKRSIAFDWRQPVDGTTKATEWQALHPLNEIVQVINPETGWIQNCNSTPFTSAGKSSPDKTKYPLYMAPDGENFRGINAIKLFSNNQKLALEELIANGYNHYLTAFDVLLPSLFKAYDLAPDSTKNQLKEPIQILKAWDRKSAIHSVATSLAVEWGTRLFAALPKANSSEEATYQTERVNALLQTINPKQELLFLAEAIQSLQARYGSWKTEWGEINRYQRPADAVFSDEKPSLPVAQVASTFGQLPSFVSRTMDTKKRYGYSGNSFIAAVEFGPKIKAKTIITGGQSFNPNNENFTDQTEMYLNGKFKEVLFYKTDVLKQAAKTYHPGE